MKIALHRDAGIFIPGEFGRHRRYSRERGGGGGGESARGVNKESHRGIDGSVPSAPRFLLSLLRSRGTQRERLIYPRAREEPLSFFISPSRCATKCSRDLDAHAAPPRCVCVWLFANPPPRRARETGTVRTRPSWHLRIPAEHHCRPRANKGKRGAGLVRARDDSRRVDTG